MNIYRELYQVKSRIKPEELFTSPEFKSSLRSAINTALHGLNRPVIFNFLAREDGKTTAYTNGQEITVNIFSPVFKDKRENVYDWYTGIIGHAVHECCHVLFTDFEADNNAIDSYQKTNFTWYPEQPKNKNAEMIADLINKYEGAGVYFASIFQQLNNIFEDQYIEKRAMDLFSGLYAESLVISNEDRYDQSPSREKIIEMADEHNLIPAALTWFWIKSLGFYSKDLKKERNLTPEEAEIEKKLNDCWGDIQPYVEILKFEKNGMERVKACNEILCSIADLTEFTENQSEDSNDDNSDEADDSENAQSQKKTSGSSDNSSNDNSEETGDTENGTNQTGPSHSSDASENDGSDNNSNFDFKNAGSQMPGTIGTEIPQGTTTPVQEPETNVIDNTAEAIDEALDHIAKAQIDQHVLMSLKKMMGSSSGIYQIYYPDTICPNFYQASVKEVNAFRDKTVNMLSRVLRERKEEEPRAYMTGKFNTRQYIRSNIHNTSEYFTRRHEPGIVPDVAFAIRIDYSASMTCNDRYISAQKAAVLLDLIFTKMKIPYMIYSDELLVSLQRIKMHLYHDFESQINHISAISEEVPDGDSTPEPFALAFGYERLMQRNEKYKVMISITDGEPNVSSGKFNEDPIEDSKMMVDYYRKKRIITFAAAIDGDMDVIKYIYGNKVMDCTEIDNIPSKLTALCRRYILK